ncbi:hypothetical protein AVEN_153678-1, partial [Araneus ventricosus]
KYHAFVTKVKIFVAVLRKKEREKKEYACCIKEIIKYRSKKYKVSDIYSSTSSGESTEVFDDEEHKGSKEVNEKCVKAGAYMLVKFQGDGVRNLN